MANIDRNTLTDEAWAARSWGCRSVGRDSLSVQHRMTRNPPPPDHRCEPGTCLEPPSHPYTHVHTVKVKGKGITIVLCHKRQMQLQRCCTSQTELIYRMQAKARGHGTLTYDKQPYAALVCRLMVSTPVIHLSTWITTHLLTPNGWKAELARLADP